MGVVDRLSKVGGGLSMALIGIGTVTVLASGYGQGNFDEKGTFENQVGVVNGSLSGYVPAPTAYLTSAGPITLQYNFTVHRYMGKNHFAFTDPITIPAVIRVMHIISVANSGDSAANVLAGDPGAVGSNPPFSEAYFLAHPADHSEVLVGTTQPFTIQFPALPPDTTDQTQDFSFTLTLPDCGYYELDSGATDVAAGHRNGFSVLTTGFVRATGCQEPPTPTPTATPTPTPTSSVQALTSTPTPSPASGVQAISTPATGAISGTGEVSAAGLALIGTGLLLAAMSAGVRRRDWHTD